MRKLTKKMVDSLVYEGAVSGRGTKGKPNGELTITPATGNHNPPAKYRHTSPPSDFLTRTHTKP